MFLPTAAYTRSNPCQITALPIVQSFSSNFSSADTSSFRSNTSLPQSINVAASGSRKCHLCRLHLMAEAAIACSTCASVVYCGEEHKELDWSRHKPSCNIPKQGTPSTVDQSISALPTSTGNGVNASHPSTSTASENKEPRLVATKDPDIQIIETGMSTKSAETNVRSRKRVGPVSGRPLKDHSKNLLFKITFQEHVKHLTDRGLVVNQHQATALRLKYIAEHVIRSLNEYGWAVVDNFLGKHHCNKAHKEAEHLYKQGTFTAGQLMDGGNKDSDPADIRSDKILWFGNDNDDDMVRSSVTIRLLIAMVDSVVVHFKNRIPPFEIAGRSKAMIAVYPGNGSRYVKHVDNPVRDGRCITTIYYCNEDWELAEHGGTLRLYPETSEMPMDVDPQADRLIFFWSDRRVPHEVLPVFRHRYAITLWYFDVKERRKAMNERLKMISESAASTAADSTATASTESNGNGENEAQAQPTSATAELSNGAAVTARQAAGEAQPTTSAAANVSFAIPTRPAQRSPMKAMTSPAAANRLPNGDNGVHIKCPVKLTPMEGTSDGDTSFESLRNSQEFRQRMGVYTGSSAATPATMDVDQQPLDLSKKPRTNDEFSDQPMTMTVSSTFLGDYALMTTPPKVSLNRHSLNSLEGATDVPQTPKIDRPGRPRDHFDI